MKFRKGYLFAIIGLLTLLVGLLLDITPQQKETAILFMVVSTLMGVIGIITGPRHKKQGI